MSAKNAVEIIKDIVATGAILLAGGWFIWQGLARPRLKIEHRIVHKPFSDGSRKVHVVADVLLSNVGNVPVDIPCGQIHVKQILPAPKPGQISADVYLRKPDKKENGQLCSPGFVNYHIEPGEGDQVHFPFDVDETVQAIQFDSFIPNPTSEHPNQGWGLQSFYDFSSTGTKSFQDATPTQTQQKLLPGLK